MAQVPDPGWGYLLTDDAQSLMSELGTLLEQGTTVDEIRNDLRRRGYPADRVAAVLTQLTLREHASTKFGAAASGMLFTRAGLEQASTRHLSRIHAERFAEAGITHVWDLGCGLGSESIAFIAAGLQVTAVEIDPFTAALARHNLQLIDPDRLQHEVISGDAATVAVPQGCGVFFDPARRTAGHRNTRRVWNPTDFSPSLEVVFDVAASHTTGVKLGPGFDHDLIPSDAEAQWVSIDGRVVELGLWTGAVRRPDVARAALVCKSDSTGVRTFELSAPEPAPHVPSGEFGEFLYEPDGSVIRAQLLGLLAEHMGAHVLDPHIAYLTSDTLHDTPFAQAFHIREEVPVKEKTLKKVLRERGIGRLEIKKRGVDINPHALRTRLSLRGPHEATLILTRTGDRHRAFLAERM